MKKRLIASVTCLCLLLVMLMSSTLAWFTDSEMSHNTMTVGNVEIVQHEKDRNGADFVQNQKLNAAHILTLVDGQPKLDGKAVVTHNNASKEYSIWDESIREEIDKIVYIENIGADTAYIRTVFAFEMMAVKDSEGNIVDWSNPIEDGTLVLNQNVVTVDGKEQSIVFPQPQVNQHVVIYRYADGDFGLNESKAEAAFVVGAYTYYNALTSKAVSDPSLLQFYLAESVGSEFFDAVDGQYEIYALSQAMQYAGFEDFGAEYALKKSFGDVNAKNAVEWFNGRPYDEYPVANVVDTGAQWVKTSTHDMIWANTTFKFEPDETYEQAQNNPFRYWHADFVVYADKDIEANAVILPGYYAAYCDSFNNGQWVGLSSDEEIKAGTQIRLVDTLSLLLGGTVTVNYEEICKWGNDGTGFLCGVSAAADAQGNYIAAGTKLTVELRLYETTADYTTSSGSKNEETGNFVILKTFEYTIPATQAEESIPDEPTLVANASELTAALAAGKNVYLTSNIALDNANITIPAGQETVINLNGKTLFCKNTESKASSAIDNKGNLTLKNGTVTYEGVGDPSFGYGTNTINNTGKLIIDGATIINTTTTGSSNAIDNAPGAELIVNSGIIKSEKVTIRLRDNSTATINGGEISGARAVQIHLFQNVDAPTTLNINGGTFTGDYALYSYAYGNCTFAKTTVTITGGTFNGLVAFGGGNKTAQETVYITGGTFNDDLGRYLANDGWEDIAKP